MSSPREPLLDVLMRRHEPRVGLVVGLVVATMLHVAVLPGARLLPRRVSSSKPTTPAAAWAGLDAAADHRRLEIELRSPPTPTPPPPVAIEPEDPRGQVVTLPATRVERPAAADFLAAQDQRTERETRSRITGIAETPTARPDTGQPREVDFDKRPATVDDVAAVRTFAGDAAPAGGPSGDGASTAGNALAWDSRDPGGGFPQALLQVPRIAPRHTIDAPISSSGSVAAGESRLAVDGNGDTLRLAMGRLTPSAATMSGEGAGTGGVGRVGGNGDGGLPGGSIAIPSVHHLERLAGLPVNDALEVEEGEETRLNTFEYRHATFFTRVAAAIRREWVGGEVLARTDPGGHVYGLDDRVTIVHVTIDTSGNVVDLALQETSGAAPLDDEALRSFRAAGPFPHPPPALFRGRDRFSFTFGFNVVYQRSHLDLDWRPY